MSNSPKREFTPDQAFFTNLSPSEELRLLRARIAELERTQPATNLSTSTCSEFFEHNGNGSDHQVKQQENSFAEQLNKLQNDHQNILERLKQMEEKQQKQKENENIAYDMQQFGTVLGIFSEQQKEQQQQIDQLNTTFQQQSNHQLLSRINEVELSINKRIDNLFENVSFFEIFNGVLMDCFGNELLKAVHPSIRAKICEKFSNTGHYCLDANACHGGLQITDGKCVTYIADGKSIRSVFANYAVPTRHSGIFYFEVEVINMKDCIAIGLATKKIPLGQMVGMHSDSYGCTSKGLLLVNGSIKNGITKFAGGDIVGIGLNLATGRIIFTKNGLPLDAFNCFVSPSVADPLFACVSLQNSGDKIITNFGPHFLFDLTCVEPLLNPQHNLLDFNACHNHLQISGTESLTVCYKENGSAWRSVFAKFSISCSNSFIFYFEMVAVNVKGNVVLGLATKSMPLDKWVGSSADSYGYSGAYRCFWINDSGWRYGSLKYSTGDVVGCGVIMDTGRIIFTKNGQILDSPDFFISSFSSTAEHLFPCISLYELGDMIVANFGPKFLFDFSSYFSEQQKLNCWENNDRHSDLELIGDNCLTVNYKGGGNGNAWRSAFAKYSSLSANSDITYFEIKVVKMKSNVRVGFAPRQRSSLAGTVHDSIGTFAYEGDGTFWVNGAKIRGNSTTKFSLGDTVGCGAHLGTRQIIFTKNGQRLDTTNWLISSPADPLFPCVSLLDCGDKIEANFGPSFKFDLASI